MAANPLRPLPSDRFDYWSALHLANRAGFGGTPAQVRALHSLGVAKAVESLVECDSIPTSEGATWDSNIVRPETEDERRIARAARQANDEETLARLNRERQQREMGDREQLREMQKWWLTRLIESGRPLEEKMTLFWHGHFAASHRTVQDSWHMLMQNRLFRQHALGSFADLVQGVIRDPAMLKYLDNDENRRRRPNENLARELMELFTLGEGRGYTENDIKEGARALTGYTLDDDAFVFRENEHDPEDKAIFGRRGPFDGDDFVDMILAKREASEFICGKLYRTFVHDCPGGFSEEQREVIAGLAKEMRTAKYQMRPVLTRLFRSEHFYSSANRAAVIKSPVQLIVQTIRAYRTPVRSISALVSAADLMGQHLFQPPNVKGWDGGRSWINTATMFVRQNLAIYLLTGRRPDLYDWENSAERFDATHLIAELREAAGEGGAGPDAEDVAEFLLRFSLAMPPRPERIETLATFLSDSKGAPENDRILATLCLITSLPEYQLC